MTKNKALRLALEALEWNMAYLPTSHDDDGTTMAIEAVAAIKEALAQPQEANNFCPRCGKRTPDPAAIRTCTPPRGLELT